MFSPALVDIRRAFPHWHISLLAKPSVADLFKESPYVDDVLLYDDPGMHAGWRGMFKLSMKIQRKKYDLAILFQNSIGAAILTRLAGIPVRLGYDTDMRRQFLTHPVTCLIDIKHESTIDYFSGLLPTLGVTPKERIPRFDTTTVEDERASSILHQYGVKSTDSLIGINPGSVYGTAKQWSFRRYAAIADRLNQTTGAKIIIFGGPGEEYLGSRMAQIMQSAPIVLSGKTSIRELMALLKRCRMLLTNDTGPMHMGAALGVPLITIFGPTNVRSTAPAGFNYKLLTSEVGCAPCLLRACPTDHACMNGIKEEEVYKEAMNLMNFPQVRKSVGVFLDRDGTINYDPGYLSNPESLKLLDGVSRAIARINKLPVKTIVVSNQSGVGRGMFSEITLAKVHARLRELLRVEAGAMLDGIYYCPHHPDDDCQCRKPRTAMVLQASKDFYLDLQRSYMIGDKALDMMLAMNVGLKGLFVKTGKNPNGELEKLAEKGIKPNYIADGLPEAIEWIFGDLQDGS